MVLFQRQIINMDDCCSIELGYVPLCTSLGQLFDTEKYRGGPNLTRVHQNDFRSFFDFRSFRGDSCLLPSQFRALEKVLPSQFHLLEIGSDPSQRFSVLL